MKQRSIWNGTLIQTCLTYWWIRWMWSQRCHARLTRWHTNRYSRSASLLAVHQFIITQEWHIHQTRIWCVEYSTIIAPSCTANKNEMEPNTIIIVCNCDHIYLKMKRLELHVFSLVANYDEIRNGFAFKVLDCACTRTWYQHAQCALSIYVPMVVCVSEAFRSTDIHTFTHEVYSNARVA